LEIDVVVEGIREIGTHAQLHPCPRGRAMLKDVVSDVAPERVESLTTVTDKKPVGSLNRPILPIWE
jgi:hypothetical protein